MDYHAEWGDSAKECVMLAIVEDGVLGEGQRTEQRMAENMGMLRFEINVDSIKAGELGAGSKLDSSLQKANAALTMHGIL